jgi:hypothetical protein
MKIDAYKHLAIQGWEGEHQNTRISRSVMLLFITVFKVQGIYYRSNFRNDTANGTCGVPISMDIGLML